MDAVETGETFHPLSSGFLPGLKAGASSGKQRVNKYRGQVEGTTCTNSPAFPGTTPDTGRPLPATSEG